MRYEKRKRKDFSFIKMFALVCAFVVLFGFLAGYDNIAKICIISAIASFDFDTSIKSSVDKASAALLSSGENKEDKKSEKTKNLAYVPDDIQSLIKSAEKTSSGDKKDGAIVEHLYDRASATNSCGNILIRNASDKTVDFESALSQKPDLNIKNPSKQPSILIFHTHTTESFQILDRDFYAVGFTSRNEDPSKNIVRVGTEIVSQLQKAGFRVIHDTKIYDKMYNGAYDRSSAAIDEYLKKYPSIQVILDIHRDAIEDSYGTKTKPVASINGKKAAQIMIITGCEGDGVTDFPDWQYNLRFALRLQKQCTDNYPELMRPLLFDNRRYNMYKSHCSLLIEIGSDSNTLDEAAYSGRLLGNTLSQMLKEYTQNT